MLQGVAIAMHILGVALIYVSIALLIHTLARFNLFFTLVQEGRAKAVLYNKAFWRVVMSYIGHRIDENDNVVEAPLTWRDYVHFPLLRGIKWIGIPPFASIHWHKFRWTSLERSVNETTTEAVTRLDHKEERIDFILVQDDTYVFGMTLVECADNIPLNLAIVLTGRSVNPKKSLFAVQHWLETTENELDAAIRPLIGTMTFNQIRAAAGTPGGQSELEVNPDVQAVMARALNAYGFKIDTLRISSANPAGELATNFVRSTAAEAVARFEAEAAIQVGRGEEARVRQIYTTVSRIPGGADMWRWDNVAKSKLTTLALGADARPVIGVGGGETPTTPPATPPAPVVPPATPPAPPTAPTPTPGVAP